MPLYAFRCSHDHTFDTLLPASAVDAGVPCPSCGERAQRVISAPNLRLVDPVRRRLVESTQATAETPSVVTQLPNRGPHRQTPVSRNPRHARLPRP